MERWYSRKNAANHDIYVAARMDVVVYRRRIQIYIGEKYVKRSIEELELGGINSSRDAFKPVIG